MARSVRGFHGRQTRSKRLTAWSLGPIDTNGAVSTSTKQLWSSGFQFSTSGTLVRVRGYLHVVLNSVSAIGAGFKGASGLGMVSVDAFTAGATAVPGPLSDLDWPGWLWHSFWDVRGVTATIADGVNAKTVSQYIEIDSKAMRKFHSGLILMGMHETTEQTTATAEYQADTRFLGMLG